MRRQAIARPRGTSAWAPVTVSGALQVRLITADYTGVKRGERILVGAQAALLCASVIGGVTLSRAADWTPPLALRRPARRSGSSARRARLADAPVQHLRRVPRGRARHDADGTDARRRARRDQRASVHVREARAAGGPCSPTRRPTPSSRWSAASRSSSSAAPALLDTDAPTYILLVLGVFLATNTLNFLLIAIDCAVVDQQDIWTSIKVMYVPVLPVEIATGLLTAARRLHLRRRQPGRDRAAAPSSAWSSSTC